VVLDGVGTPKGAGFCRVRIFMCASFARTAER
jgi:hypothetical protein